MAKKDQYIKFEFLVPKEMQGFQLNKDDLQDLKNMASWAIKKTLDKVYDREVGNLLQVGVEMVNKEDI